MLGKSYDYTVIDAGNHINSCSVAALYAADTIFVVTNPDVPSVRNAQRLVDRVRQLGVGGERIRILLNRGVRSDMIAPKQIETALGYGDSPHIPERLQGRVHRAQLRRAAGPGEQLGDRCAVRQLHAPDHLARRSRREGRQPRRQARLRFSFSFLS